MYQVTWRLMVVVTLLIASTSCRGKHSAGSGSPDARAYKLEEQTLGPVHSQRSLSVVSDDGCRWAYAIISDGGSAVVVDGQPEPRYDRIIIISFSPNGKRVAYVAERKGKRLVVLDGTEGKEYDGIMMTMSYGISLSSALRGKATYSGALALVFSPDGSRLAYVASRVAHVAEKEKESFLVTDGVEGKTYDSLSPGSLMFSPDSRRLVCTARKGSKYVVVVDGIEGNEYESISADPVFSADGKHLAYAALKNGESVPVMDGQEGKADIGPARIKKIIFSPDGKRIAYVTESNGPSKNRVILDGIESTQGYDQVEGACFSLDSRQMAFVGLRGNRSVVVLNNSEVGEHDWVFWDTITFGVDGKHLGYLARKGERGKGAKCFPVIDGQPGPEYDDVGQYVVSPRRAVLAFCARKGDQWVAVVDGKEEPASDSIIDMPVFSSDGKTLAWRAQRGSAWTVVVGGQTGRDYDEIIAGPAFRPGGAVEYLAIRANTLYRARHILVNE